MTRRRKRFLTILAVVAVILIAGGTWLYVAFYGPTGVALQRAENFLLRRMTVAQLGGQGEYRFFYATNRVPAVADRPLLERFGNERRGQLHYGHFDTEIEPTLGLGMLINPTDWFQNEEIQLLSVESLQRDAFVEGLRRVVERSPFRSLLIVVHGFREAFPSALRKTAFLGHVLDLNSPVLLFDWPGNQGTSISGYRRAHAVAQQSGTELAGAIRLIVDEVRPDRLWVLANSMGAQVVVDAFSDLYESADFADQETEIENVILTAPDVDTEEFNERFKQEITALAGNLAVYVSSNDRALLLSRIINRGRRKGESMLDPDMLEEAIRVSELIEPDSDLITLVDVTPVNRTRNFHSFSLETPEFFDDLYLRLTNAVPPNSRLLYRIETPDGSVFWILTRGR
jgi:esterase/lipase superfamily enzyme